MKLILATTMVVLLTLMCSCQSFDQNLDKMSETEYGRVERETYLFTKIIVREFFKAKPEVKGVIQAATELIGKEAIENGKFLDELVTKINDPEVRELVELAMLEVGKYGVYEYLDDMSDIIQSRTTGLVVQASYAVIDAANE